ncbi:MAG: glycosyltransferase family 2 protein, partial [Longicatena caecimuris]
MKDLISIVTPTYNGENFIAETIKSVQAQTYEHWEMLIVDDLSTDNTVEIVKAFAAQDARIKFFILPEKGGA